MPRNEAFKMILTSRQGSGARVIEAILENGYQWQVHLLKWSWDLTNCWMKMNFKLSLAVARSISFHLISTFWFLFTCGRQIETLIIFRLSCVLSNLSPGLKLRGHILYVSLPNDFRISLRQHSYCHHNNNKTVFVRACLD